MGYSVRAPEPTTSARRISAHGRATLEDGDARRLACWAVSNHDVHARTSRAGATQRRRPELAWPSCVALVLFAARQRSCLYQGEELGLPEAELAVRSDYAILTASAFWPDFKGRDGCRTPMAVELYEANGGFSAARPRGFPVPAEHGELSVAAQDSRADSVPSVKVPDNSDSGATTKFVDRRGMIELVRPQRRQQPQQAPASSSPSGRTTRPPRGGAASRATPGHSSIASHTAKPTRKARVTAARRPSRAINSPVGKRRHQIIDDRPLHLARPAARSWRIGEGVLQHRHHDQARARGNRRRNLHVPDRHRPPATAQRDGENHQKQQGRDRRRPHRLQSGP